MTIMNKSSLGMAFFGLAFAAIVCAPGCGNGGKVCDGIDTKQNVVDSDTLSRCSTSYPIVTIGVTADQCNANLDGDCGARYETYLECVRATPICNAADGTVQPGTTQNCNNELSGFKMCLASHAAVGGAGGSGSTVSSAGGSK
jgi:hypothetical protein